MGNHQGLKIPPKLHLADLQKLFTIKEISNLYQVSTRTAHLWMRIRELNDPRRDKIPPDEQRPLYEALIRGEIDYPEIAKKYCISQNIARDYLLRFGPVPSVKKPKQASTIRKIPKAVQEQYTRDYYLGLYDAEDIREILGIPLQTAKKMIRINGITGFETPTDEELEEVERLSIEERCEHFSEPDEEVVKEWYRQLNLSKRDKGVSA